MCHCFALLATSCMFRRREEKWVSERRETCRWIGRLGKLLTSRWVAHRGWPKCSSTLNGQQTVPPPVPRVLSSVLSAHLKNMNGSDATILGEAHVSERKKRREQNSMSDSVVCVSEVVSMAVASGKRKWKQTCENCRWSCIITADPGRQNHLVCQICERLWRGD